MSRSSITAAFKAAAYAGETSEAILVLIEITHSEIAIPIRVTSDGVDTISNSNTFIAFPFTISLPTEGDGPPRATLTIDNVDRTIISSIRAASSNEPPVIKIQVVLGSDPDTIEAEFDNFELSNVKYDQFVIEGELSVESFLNEPYPAGLMTPSLFPGVF